jgi:hypothetical protein
MPYDPTFQRQGPAANCVINGRALGWLSCSAYGMAMAIDDATRGRRKPTGCAVRSYTGDTVGGLSLPQVARVARERYGVAVEVRTGSNVASDEYVANRLRAGRPIALQGNTGAFLGTQWQSTGGPVNHLIELSRSRGGTMYQPDEALVYDPAADGRGNYAQGPDWIPWEVVERFAARLEPWGDGRILGPARMYAGILPDGEPDPTLVLRYGARPTTPLPVKFLARAASGQRVNVRSAPFRTARIVDTMAPGERFWAAQLTTRGERITGRTGEKWYSGYSGTLWVHETGLRKP